ncbi:hypothetical protein B1A99_03930 [Cohnella sp. CIP 111063]|uniref:ThuA domain-containing protein n=1 Tax=unclassified Cohnella TaxID=2636738 RepID=UPI000B8C12CB|nr:MULTISPECIES: ThuA domain-containing protein [unclassified Cohnella]OXS61766.1 hypothetical protein B1A99_03930 [Cohnella sp. CIP 111063]PRX74205.1 glucose/arabinose dehydrogenase [Cohnella sp. SGD-V74]
MRKIGNKATGDGWRQGLKGRIAFLVCTLAIAAIALIVYGLSSGGEQTSTKPGGGDSSAEPEAPYKVLVFSKTGGFRHDSIPAGIEALRKLGAANGFEADATEDSSRFSPEGLKPYSAVVFLNTTGEILSESEQAAFQAYIQAGGGYVGIHSASDTLHAWPWYMNLVGGMFTDHPAIAKGAVRVADKAHPSTAELPTIWTKTEEWYNFLANPRGEVHVLATVDEESYEGGTMGADHPVSWCREFDGGRSWYTGLGHAAESYTQDEHFLRHVLGGIQWAAGKKDGDCSATLYDDRNYQKQELASALDAPLALDFAPDGRLIFIEIGGAVKIYDPSTGATSAAGKLGVVSGNEQGLLGLALDPEFASNGWIYLFYSPVGETSEDRLSRFTMKGGVLDLASEKAMLSVPTQRVECCHHGGNLEFGGDGYLYVATGDNVNPFASDGFSPTDEGRHRTAWDAQGTSGNTNDLRGKILRIKPEKDGTYSIPEGNLFPEGGGEGRPEIYVMGVRNPYRMTISPFDNALYWGDVGPDAGADKPLRGPKGYDEFNKATTAGNFGWPYCIADNKPYRDYDFLFGGFGPAFDCAGSINDSPNNTGARKLPPAQGAFIYYPYGPSEEFPQMTDGTGRTAAVGSMYKYDPGNPNEFKLPAYLNGSLILFDFSRQWFKEAKFDDSGSLMTINPFLTHLVFDHPIYAKVGPDGELYVIEFGTGGPDGKISKISYSGAAGNQAPLASAKASATNGLAPLAVTFSSEGTKDTEGDAITYAWDFDGDGKTDSVEATAGFTYETNGNYNAKFTATDSEGNASSVVIPVTVGNRAPVVTIRAPAARGFFSWGDEIRYEVTVTDAEDGEIDCSKVQVTPALGHDEHNHPSPTLNGCSGTFRTMESDTNVENTFLYLTASYTDAGTEEANALTGTSTITLLSSDRQAEYFDESSGGKLQTENTEDTGGGRNLGFIENGSWIAYKAINLVNMTGIRARVSSAGAGGTIEMRADSETGPLLATLGVPKTGDWQKWVDVESGLTSVPAGERDIYFVFRGGDGYLFNVNKFDFLGSGIAVP